MIPRATVRLQLHKDFGFAAAARRAGYFARLGISHLYVSPILQARAGSMHGYDVTDHGRINPELGGADGFREMMRELRRHGLGLIVDIVPNHMAVGSANARWLDVLERGMDSPNAAFFDIDWDPPNTATKGKIHAPFLGAPYADVLHGDAMALTFDAAGGGFRLAVYGEHVFPIRPEDDAAVLQAIGGETLAGFADASVAAGRDHARHLQVRRKLATAATADASLRAALDRGMERLTARKDWLGALLDRQHYRLAWWRTAADEINWRRFFDVNELIAVQVERPEVFDAVHELILKLYAEGLIDGLRIDHIDGLTDPLDYCRKLRAALDARASQRPAGVSRERAYLIVEKILAAGEALSSDWPIDGTSGYDFMNEVSAVQHHSDGCVRLGEYWHEISGRPAAFHDEERAARREILAHGFGAMLETAAIAFRRVVQRTPAGRDMPLASFRRALSAIVEAFPVYRTYATSRGSYAGDGPVLDRVEREATRVIGEIDRPTFDFVLALLRAQRYGDPLQARAAMRFQQLSAPLAAKAVEDTAFYRYGRLLSRNDVGFDPARCGADAGDFHRYNVGRAAAFPATLLATATHDHKRGEDVRARLAVLSELPDAWIERARAWHALNAARRPPQIAAADEYMLYQTLVGCWPLDVGDDLGALRERVAGWQEKSLREAKLRSSWIKPDTAYEGLCRDFLGRLIDRDESAEFLGSLAEFVGRIAVAGAMNGLVQAHLRCLSPGVPDLYQGSEWWDFSLVDPDNRRPVDFDARERGLDGAAPPASLMEDWRDGRVKQALIAADLAARRDCPEVFARSDYVPLQVEGACADRLVAFARRSGRHVAIVGACRRWGRELANSRVPLPPADAWNETHIRLPRELGRRSYVDPLDGGRIAEFGETITARELFARLPVSLHIAH